jgi:Ala-tRNA(Pro) deacylase
MAIASNLQGFLAAKRSVYDLRSHARTQSSTASAQAAHVPGRCLAKAVVVEDDRGYVLAVVPSTHHVALSELERALGRAPLRLATEAEIEPLFADCELGALPPVGGAYAMPSIVEKELDAQSEVFFEAGDHEHLVHMTRDEFSRLTADAPRAHFSRIDPGLSRIGGGSTA